MMPQCQAFGAGGGIVEYVAVEVSPVLPITY
jgi:hypothetical protein